MPADRAANHAPIGGPKQMSWPDPAVELLVGRDASLARQRPGQVLAEVGEDGWLVRSA